MTYILQHDTFLKVKLCIAKHVISMTSCTGYHKTGTTGSQSPDQARYGGLGMRLACVYTLPSEGQQPDQSASPCSQACPHPPVPLAPQ